MNDEKTRRVKGRLQQSKSKLDTLLKITTEINGDASQFKLFEILKLVLTNDLAIGKFVLFTHGSEKWKASLFEGIYKEDAEKINFLPLIQSYNDIGIISEKLTSPSLNAFDIVIPVFHKDQPLAYMILADMEGEKIEISPIIKHLRFIQTLINIVIVALENQRLKEEQLKQVSIKKELELAQNMQSLLFPRKLPNQKNIYAKALYLPHSEVGGDYYDIIQLKKDKVAICIADVSGKGMSAALLMANFQANLRALIPVSNSIEQLIELCNKKIIESANYEKFITLFVAIFDPKKKTLTYVNSGHQPPILFQKKSTRFLTYGSTVLGMFDDLPSLSSETIKLENNAILVCYTDGLTEMEDEKGNQLEAEGIEKLLRKEKSLKGISNQLKGKIRELENLSRVEDDITFLAVEFLR